MRWRAVALAAALLGWHGWVASRIPTRWSWPVKSAVGASLVALTRASLGLRPPVLWSGLRWGSVAAAVVAAGVAASTAVPPVRTGMAERLLPADIERWLLLRIPLGTVWPEEAAFRAALGTVGAGAFGRTGGRLLQAIAFGLSHVDDARRAREPVFGTVLVTGATGWLLGWLSDRSGSLPRQCWPTSPATKPAGSRRWWCSDERLVARRSVDPATTRAAVTAVADWLRDDTRPAPTRANLAEAVRLTARTLAAVAPGASVEVRVPPFVAVQCIAGPRHTRGTPPNVVETDPRTWLLVATGLLGVAAAADRGALTLSGSRAGEIADWLPVLRLQK